MAAMAEVKGENRRHSFRRVKEKQANKLPNIQERKGSQDESDEVEYERIRQSGRDRYKDLSRPKEQKIEWWTNVGPNVSWGTQEMMWPVSRSIPDATDRVKTLASPKKNFQTGQSSGRPLFYYSCGRASMVWELKPLQQQANVRVQELSRSKELHRDHRENRREYLYSCGRNTPIWLVGKGAQNAEDRPRTRQLAEPKQPPKEYEGARQIETIIPKSALKGEPSERTQSLSFPKKRPEGPFRDPVWSVPVSAKNASATERCAELARSKSTPDSYQKPKDEMWPVSKAARRATATPRVDELSKPIVRASMDHVQFNPDAFLVKETALKGVVPKRIETLSRPIDR
ncbi:Hypothetical predicted protein [Mytilus galloprovincialis]|uniref:Testicular haploid expressed gene protein-like n=2 Tax=Mytilus galloprovincialis TaxID=29158 RepID=A0A8B6GD53_MYTGA|nr:Hypothetical predicted protein [Mytilus galloprovincialis]